MKTKFTLFAFVAGMFAINTTYAQTPPLVYGEENTGADCTAPVLPEAGDLIAYPMLPDPFSWSDGSGRSTDFADWECRRNEIKAEIEAYEIGPKPVAPENITATYADGVLTVNVTENGQTLTLTSNVTMPTTGTAPYPVIIGMNSGTGSIPASLFEGAIQIPFMHNQVVTYSNTSTKVPTDPYYSLYPELINSGNYSAWSWGISRLIDGLEIVQAQINADMNHIGVTGCSYAGKMALFAGAFDERIALTIAQESGGGGANSWRVSETIGNVEKIDNTNYSWFMTSMGTNFGGRAEVLPHDHHELMAMVAPRALFVLGNTDYEWLGDESGYVSDRAVEKVYQTFGIEDRFGFSIRGGHPHCNLPEVSYPEVGAFIDRFLFGDTEADTDIHVHPFPDTDYQMWIEDWDITADPNTPTVFIDSPADYSSYEEPVSVTITASTTDADNNITKVEFYNGEILLGEDTSAPYSFTWEDVTGGTYFIWAKVIDAQNLEGMSNVRKIQVLQPTPVIYRVSTPPTIDGAIDDVWNDPMIQSFNAQTVLVGDDIDAADLSGWAKAVWDDTYIYLLAYITDDVKKNDSPNAYEDDSIEYYFDGNNGKTDTYEDDDVQYTLAWNDNNSIASSPASIPTTGIESVMADTEDGYIVETKIPWANFGTSPADGVLIGFDFMINDDDDENANRDGKISWNATADSAYQNTSVFGTIQLSGTVLGFNQFTNNSVKVYPNPAQNTIWVAGLTNEFEYKIIDVSGKLCLSGRATNAISLENLPKGFYFLNISDGANGTYKKIIKN
ncbi:glucuronyl esterase domain-containing protein [Flavobacterium rhizosphaerae]|uniref:Sugar-binding protein n=1 Tax=Flavobacterium rhizosphaerae TaxID=3163298 RepID=A0ABW8YR72_9FLAO